MAQTGEPFNVARRTVEAATAGPLSRAELVELKRTGRCDLSNQDLTGLPPGIVQFPNLRELRLDGNQLTTLPAEIAQLAVHGHSRCG